MKVSVDFSFNDCCKQCQVSKDVFDVLSRDTDQLVYSKVWVPQYTRQNLDFVLHCTCDSQLPLNTIRIPARLFGISVGEFTSDYALMERVNSRPPSLTQIFLLIRDQLYDKLLQLPTEHDIMEFFSKKYGVVELGTVVHENEILDPQWCQILSCNPYKQGVVNFDSTKITLIRDDEHLLMDVSSTTQIPIENADYGKLPFESLREKVSREMLVPEPCNSDDDSLYVFATMDTLVSLNVISGSLVRLKSEQNSSSSIAKMFVFLSPNQYESGKVYLTPRLMYQFHESSSISIWPYHNLDVKQIPIAKSVSLARIGSWHQSQKVFQNIILHSLKQNFMDKRRILKVGDKIPVVFDSSLLPFFENGGDGPAWHNELIEADNLVWFKVEEVDFNNDENSTINKDAIFLVDPTEQTKLVTVNVVNERPLPLNKCDFLSFYRLDSVFQFDYDIFPYAKKLTNIVESSLKREQSRLNMDTSILLHSSNNGTGKNTLLRSVSLSLGIHFFETDCRSLATNLTSVDSTAKILGFIKARIGNPLSHATPAIVYISHLEHLFTQSDPNQDPVAAKLSRSFEAEFVNLAQHFMHDFHNVVFIASTNDISTVPSRIRSRFQFEIEVPTPTEPQRRDIFRWYLSQDQLNKGEHNSFHFTAAKDVDYLKLALHSAGLKPLNIKSIVQTAKAESYRHYQSNTEDLIWQMNCCVVTMEALQVAINKARDEFSESIGAPKIPNVTWADIGGIDVVKGEIMDTIDLPLKHPELFRSGMKKRSGILFYGPPGTGKTLMAKAIATNFSLNFFSVKGPELLNMYIGESEANVRKVFQKAREAKPCIIFFDEIDSVAPKRGNQGDSGGVMDRIVSQLLAELDGMGEDGDGVFVVGATNRPDLLDEALLRPGRFDKLLYLGIPDTDEKQLNILKALTRKFDLAEDVDLLELAQRCPFNYTGADFYALCSDSILNAMTRVAGDVDRKVEAYNEQNDAHVSVNKWFDSVAKEEDTAVQVQMSDFVKALQETKPSVSKEELAHYLQVKKTFEG
ncbi:AAA family ATPase peroxin 6 KNAG_0K02600 [Huiozyma naganishii CBS 8797]|uniref:Peroxisomal ATPase PEX6 n=1 Tax=Huiozyma naganishii (strain ATCC MYA-139 / BCRC 22969 / CBS 8797 / KCTC 17520 / NBRC 10181 / NCYC 3082 / Yp74L-3) TaxID=1071383 RepID=J7RRW6_HUIN7|nr:hypothetical protein KNAG_0K02600 [Kazachstania naganishii CBS 8797]CCK72623.1 hypothetical protein KNAG_0K02600 [Kazachstania naganishii CBS 8797]